MTVELAEVAAGLPVAASFALAGGISSLREGRRRAALNEAMHELRRPLQALTLCLPVDGPEAAPVESSLRLASVALERLDREINGASLEEVHTEVSVRVLAEAAVQRWERAAARREVSLEMEGTDEETYVEGSPFDLAQALDNLLSNALEHGSGQVTVKWRREGNWVRVSVTDSGGLAIPKTKRRRSRRDGRCRRGHGLRVVGRIAAGHGGSFGLRRGSRGTEASLRLPVSRLVEEG
jgi:signal transduction histidine kinase